MTTHTGVETSGARPTQRGRLFRKYVIVFEIVRLREKGFKLVVNR